MLEALQILPRMLNFHKYYKEQLFIPILQLQNLSLREVSKGTYLRPPN